MKVKVAVLGFPSLIIYTVSVEVKNVELERKSNLQITIPWEFLKKILSAPNKHLIVFS